MSEDKKPPTQSNYDNTQGSLYKVAEQRGWNSYQFDLIKRIDRCLRKGEFKKDLEKTKFLIDLWIGEEEPKKGPNIPDKRLPLAGISVKTALRNIKEVFHGPENLPKDREDSNGI